MSELKIFGLTFDAWEPMPLSKKAWIRKQKIIIGGRSIYFIFSDNTWNFTDNLFKYLSSDDFRQLNILLFEHSSSNEDEIKILIDGYLQRLSDLSIFK